ncbi:MAG: hypothetical protein SFZ24_08115 [Planctomycetota bacterium]|nr:hypothetical protein [Planctomycetota bacterium]
MPVGSGLAGVCGASGRLKAGELPARGGPRLFVLAAACAALAGDVLAGGPACSAAQSASKLAPFFERARSGRVDVVGLGDSNQVFGGHGWDHGWGRTLAARFGLYATPLFSAGENQGNGSSIGYRSQAMSTLPANQFAYAGAPAGLDAFLPGSTPVPPLNYVCLLAGTGGAGFTPGVYIEAGGPLSVAGALRLHMVYAEFGPGTTGFFQPAIRLGQWPYTQLVAGPVISTAGAAPGVRTATLDLPPAARNSNIEARWSPFGTTIAAPFLAYFQRLEAPDQPHGASFTTLYAQGGQSARDMAASLLTAPDEQLTLFFSQIRALQSDPRAVLIRVHSGLNDRNETLPSTGPTALTPGSSPAAFADNLRQIIQRIELVWSAAGWPTSELFFLFTVSHPVSTPDDPLLLAYRDAADAVAADHPRAAAVRLDRLTSETEMLASGWYRLGGADRNHLEIAAYQTLAERELAALAGPACPGDADGDGSASFADITAALARWGACGPDARGGDANADGAVNFTDITITLRQWGPCTAD